MARTGEIWIWIRVADLQAHRTLGGGGNGIPDDSTYWTAMPCEMHILGRGRTHLSILDAGVVSRPGTQYGCIGTPGPFTSSAAAQAMPVAQPLAPRLPQPLHAPTIASPIVPRIAPPQPTTSALALAPTCAPAPPRKPREGGKEGGRDGFPTILLMGRPCHLKCTPPAPDG